MATLTEKIDSREWTTGEKPTVTMHYTLDGTPDDLTAKMLLLNSTPTEYDGLVRDECTLDPIFVDTTTGQGKWECTVRYVAPENTQPPVGVTTVVQISNLRISPFSTAINPVPRPVSS